MPLQRLRLDDTGHSVTLLDLHESSSVGSIDGSIVACITFDGHAYLYVR